MTREELKNYLPHREPMLLVDEINTIASSGQCDVKLVFVAIFTTHSRVQ